ncbi:hypothetical protein K523DRAFT_27379 [Schizophyllum commune Tattone D]|nr:hypothetical protein K523DRAFT_27379 [Schizophyllum commune Tattone D]
MMCGPRHGERGACSPPSGSRTDYWVDVRRSDEQGGVGGGRFDRMAQEKAPPALGEGTRARYDRHRGRQSGCTRDSRGRPDIGSRAVRGSVARGPLRLFRSIHLEEGSPLAQGRRVT